MTKKLFIAAIVGILSSAIAASAESAKVIVDDPVTDFVITQAGGPDSKILLIHKDFNNDGILDMAIGLSDYFGTGGGPWELYLGREDGKFEHLPGQLGFSPAGYKIVPYKKGIGRVRGCIHDTSARCNPFEYEINAKGIKAVSISKKVNYRQFDPSVQYCSWKEFSEKGSCTWSK